MNSSRKQEVFKKIQEVKNCALLHSFGLCCRCLVLHEVGMPRLCLASNFFLVSTKTFGGRRPAGLEPRPTVSSSSPWAASSRRRCPSCPIFPGSSKHRDVALTGKKTWGVLLMTIFSLTVKKPSRKFYRAIKNWKRNYGNFSRNNFFGNRRAGYFAFLQHQWELGTYKDYLAFQWYVIQ